MFAGVGGQGAHDGAYTTAVYCEIMKLLGIRFTGEAADLYKCFDQIVRKLVYKILDRAGCLPAYWGHMQDSWTRWPSITRPQGD